MIDTFALAKTEAFWINNFLSQIIFIVFELKQIKKDV